MNPSLFLVSFSLFTWGIGEGMFWYFQPIYLNQLGADTMTIAGVFSVFGIAMMVGHIPAGYLSDKIGRRPILWVAWFIGVLSACIMALAVNLQIFVMGMVLYGFTALVSSPLFSYVTAARGKLTTTRAMSLTSAAFNLGAIIGPISGGLIATKYGLRSIYFVMTAFFIFSFIILLFLKAQPQDSHNPSETPQKLIKNRKYLVFIGFAFTSVFVMFLAQPLTPNFLEMEKGLSLSQIGIIGSIGSFGSVAINLLLGQLNPRVGFLFSQGLVGLFALFLWKGNHIFWFGLGYFLLGGYRTARFMIFAQVRSFIHQAQMGLAYGLTDTLNSLAIIMAPLLAGWLYTQNPISVFMVSFGLIMISIMAGVLFIPKPNPEPFVESPYLKEDN